MLFERRNSLRLQENVERGVEIAPTAKEEEENQEEETFIDSPANPAEEQQQPPTTALSTVRECITYKKTCILMYISTITLIVASLGYLASLAKHLSPEMLLSMVEKYLNKTQVE